MKAARSGRSWTATRRITTIHIVLIAAAAVFLLPYYWMVITTITPPDQAAATGVSLIPHGVSFDTYENLLTDDQITLPRWFLNSLIISVAATLLGTSVAFLAAFVLARRRPPGYRLFFLLIIATLMVPGEVALIGLFYLINGFGLLDTYPGIVFPLAVYAVVFLILYNFIAEIPRELEEAAMIDGASTWRLLRHVFIPLSRPAFAAAGVLQFLACWQAFTIPYLLVTSNDMYPVSVAVLFQESELYSTVQQTLSLATLITLPVVVVFVLLQRRVFRGVAAGAVKQ